jgi:hypothetical protein
MLYTHIVIIRTCYDGVLQLSDLHLVSQKKYYWLKIEIIKIVFLLNK